MAEEKMDEFSEKSESRNENLSGRKSTQAPKEEGKEEQRLNERPRDVADRQPEELKASAEILPEDAQTKSELSEE